MLINKCFYETLAFHLQKVNHDVIEDFFQQQATMALEYFKTNSSYYFASAQVASLQSVVNHRRGRETHV